ncbi:transcriptional repressor [Streptomyces silvisoli]|uniref:Transcriptional repressor n=1 Tax=Streptomyces silvisoli TaxID=3034235 RepID=A0ABT5ZGL6_9ACTN|nr:transcriptional repressor [Streptomyces silvisoli]MDF3288816.1 transcriptional repressor [Streptomyces silvisoli]
MSRNRPHSEPSQEVAAIGRPTPQRAVVLADLVAAGDFVSAQALHKRLLSGGSPVGLSTVYRTLTALTGICPHCAQRQPQTH